MTYLSDSGHGVLDLGEVWHRQSGRTNRTPAPSCNEQIPGPLRYRPLTASTRGGRELCPICFRKGREL